MQVPDWYDGDVSRETLEKLKAYAALLRRWTSKINLISKATQDDLEQRHIWDSAQIYEPADGKWLDIGSGGGLPGVVVAILAQGDGQIQDMTMVESDQRKATFLRACARELGLPFKVLAGRVEDQDRFGASIISARALAGLDHLLGLSAAHLVVSGHCVFMKGASWRDEITIAQRRWRFSCHAIPSKTNAEAAILKIKDIHRV